MISLHTAIYSGAILGAIGSATLSRIGDQLADDVSKAVAKAFGDNGITYKETPFYETLSKRDLWKITLGGAGVGALAGAAFYKVTAYAIDFL